jgi:dihydroorotate dehydrogenase electron transfer subunit
MKKTVQSLQVISHRRLNSDHVVLELKSDEKLEGILPGQFANILVEGSQKVFLRRPFSIYQVDYNCNTISILIKAIGDGTRALSDQSVGDQLSVIFPLGNGFNLPSTPAKVLLVGGGVGIAALMILAKMLKEFGHQVVILLGAKRIEDLVELGEFNKYGTTHTTTEDGTHGTKGYVTDHPLFEEECSSFEKIYTCGPEPMMKAVARKALIHHVNCEVSLENTMACGYGVCLCCVTETIDGHRCVCTDGPVFDIKRLKWQI